MAAQAAAVGVKTSPGGVHLHDRVPLPSAGALKAMGCPTVVTGEEVSLVSPGPVSPGDGTCVSWARSSPGILMLTGFCTATADLTAEVRSLQQRPV
ncbi:hypothetical protein NDU88_002537 [Pleurodeles waltl]|uniref:Uncharacterized protein n=1 Tax=Pleurodeles waltl TaxID=8319 RepID=A0AAV7UVW6_PLEWA|nr:hypothetical protein NDU88_002537 [Pleurodeles waltl]